MTTFVPWPAPAALDVNEPEDSLEEISWGDVKG
jgi:hypothetical protein